MQSTNSNMPFPRAAHLIETVTNLIQEDPSAPKLLYLKPSQCISRLQSGFSAEMGAHSECRSNAGRTTCSVFMSGLMEHELMQSLVVFGTTRKCTNMLAPNAVRLQMFGQIGRFREHLSTFLATQRLLLRVRSFVDG
jgi:hypothetical protein